MSTSEEEKIITVDIYRYEYSLKKIKHYSCTGVNYFHDNEINFSKTFLSILINCINSNKNINYLNFKQLIGYSNIFVDRFIRNEVFNLTNLKTLKISVDAPKERYNKEKYPISNINGIGNLVNLENLSINIFKIPTISPEIGNMTNLKNLDLRFNYIESIPSEIGNLVNLKKLDLLGNKIREVPNSIGNLENLEKLNLAENEISEVPSELENCKKLRYLNLVQNKIEKLPKELFVFENIRCYLAQNPLNCNTLREYKLTVENEELKTMVKYMPGGDGYLEAKEHFDGLQENN